MLLSNNSCSRATDSRHQRLVYKRWTLAKSLND